MKTRTASWRSLGWLACLLIGYSSLAAQTLAAESPSDLIQPLVDEHKGEQLKFGSTGRLVESLQRTLNARMKPSPGISVDGDFGPNTQATLIKFQELNKLPTTGLADEATWAALGPLIEEDEPVADPELINAAVVEKKPADSLRGPPVVTCKAWAIGDAVTGKLLWGHDERSSLPMASTTKIMTAHVVLQLALDDPRILDQPITFSRNADETPGSTCHVRVGESISARELLYGLLLPSGNDASVALAEHFGGQLGTTADATADAPSNPDAYTRFVDAMNRTAADLHLTETRFTNTHGLTDEGHHSSAQDLMTLAWQALKNPLLRSYVNTIQRGCTVTGPGGYQRNLHWKNSNRLLRIEGYDGVKTGTTSAAGSCLVSRGDHDGDSLIVVVLGSTSTEARYADTRNLYRWAFNQRQRDTSVPAVSVPK